MKLEQGRFYFNGRGDERGPMDERAPGVWLDQFGVLYHPDGRQWDHVEGSTGNIVKENNPTSMPPAGGERIIPSGFFRRFNEEHNYVVSDERKGERRVDHNPDERRWRLDNCRRRLLIAAERNPFAKDRRQS